MREKFIDKKFKDSTLDVIAHANKIILEYAAQGFVLTLRQLYYQFVARDLLRNTQRNYKRLMSIVSNGRLAGMIDWNAIEDRTRELGSVSHWSNPEQIIQSAAEGFRIDKWETQPYRVECWIEKEALVGVVERICTELDIAWFACRGYVSQSEQYDAGKRFARYNRAAKYGQEVIVLHLGDHDPSGIDMTRDNDERLQMFSRDRFTQDAAVTIRRLALNEDQVEQYDPPPDPAKFTDSRYEGYVERFGTESWELDALEPQVLQDLVRDATLEYRDEDLWDAAVEREDKDRAHLGWVANNWDRVTAFKESEDEDEE